mgnify:CR=1 FL=1
MRLDVANNQTRRKGSYAPLSAHYYKDDAIAQAGEGAELLYVRGLAFCADVLNDGFITDMQLCRFVGVGTPDAQERAERLAAVGLWKRDRKRGGYLVRSWLDWNLSRSDIESRLRQDATRKARGKGVDSNDQH